MHHLHPRRLRPLRLLLLLRLLPLMCVKGARVIEPQSEASGIKKRQRSVAAVKAAMLSVLT